MVYLALSVNHTIAYQDTSSMHSRRLVLFYEILELENSTNKAWVHVLKMKFLINEIVIEEQKRKWKIKGKSKKAVIFVNESKLCQV